MANPFSQDPPFHSIPIHSDSNLCIMIMPQLFVFPIIVLIYIPPTLAMIALEGPCPSNMTAVGDLDMDRFLGKWYTYSVYPTFSKRVPKCQTVEFKKEEDKIWIKRTELSTKTDTLKIKVEEIRNVDPSHGKYDLITTNSAFPEGIQINVLDTDYDNFAIRYMCFDSNNLFSFHWAVIQTRIRLPTSDIIYTAQVLARKSGIVLSKMIKIPQHSCPPDA
ncbi:lopap [Drosophila pseudoobscura]|uniref:Lopap n=1 Tax=Drosophila pseudoobscura pseudoobscura TaxID=46245 RepID=A0A6I8UKY2_DROPS|nr:lopap [Drosophila pseudoobscura]